MKTLIHFVLFLLFVFTCYQPINAQTYFSDDFESGKSKWIIGGNNWDTLSSTYNSSNHCITDSRLGNYTYNSDPTITMSTTIDLTSSTYPVLTFYHRYNIYAYSSYRDNIYVQISTNAGFNWTTIQNWQYTNWAWSFVQFDLRNYKNSLVKFRFMLSSHNGYPGTADGWYIDDVKIQEFISVNPSFIFPFTDNFENGLGKWNRGSFNWDTTSATYSSPTHCVTDSRSGNYTYDSDPTLTMAGVLDLSNTVFPVLTFFHRYNIYAYSSYRDNIYVQISTNGGFNWTTLDSWQYTNLAWTYAPQYDLSNYRTSNVKIRFWLSSHNGYPGVSDGWFIDDVSISDFNPAYINLNLKLLLEGMYDNVSNEMSSQDTFKVYLRNISSPYNFRDSAKGVISPFTHAGQFYFKNAPSGNYYIVVKHRNTIETWSKSGGTNLVRGDGSVNNYDFTTDSCQAWGCNQIRKGSKWCLFSGDINQDGIIDGTDLAIVDNDASDGVGGYVRSDVTGDYFVDGSDASIVDNNVARFVTVMRP